MARNQERLQKVIAHAGIASRRASETLIQEGRVTVNGRVVTEMGVKVDRERDQIVVDGEPLSRAEKLVYIALNKPPDVLSTTQDDRDRGRLTVLDLVEEIDQRVYPVGRLDQQSQGLMLLTNDGGLAEKLTHPRYHIQKEYRVLVKGKPTAPVFKRWREGDVEIDGQRPKPAVVSFVSGDRDAVMLKVILTEGRKRQIRLTAKALGYPVKKLERVRIGPISLGHLKVGHWRYLSPQELHALRQAVENKARSGKRIRNKSSKPPHRQKKEVAKGKSLDRNRN